MRSGILAIDNPTESDTLIYKNEYKTETRKKKARMKIKLKYKENVKLKR